MNIDKEIHSTADADDVCCRCGGPIFGRSDDDTSGDPGINDLPPNGLSPNLPPDLWMTLLPKLSEAVSKTLDSLREADESQTVTVEAVEGGYILQTRIRAPLKPHAQEAVDLVLEHAVGFIEVGKESQLSKLGAALGVKLRAWQADGILFTRPVVRRRVVTSLEDLPHAIAMMLDNSDEKGK